jgi:hypothetical protein
MATVNLRTGTAGNSGFDMTAMSRLFVLEKTIDFTETATAAAVAADVLQLLDIPAMTAVLAVYAHVETAMGTAGTMEIGDGSDADGFIDSLDLNTVAVAKHDGPYLIFTDSDVTGNIPVPGGKVYTAAGVLQGTLGGTLADLGKVHFYVLCVRLTTP